MITYHLKLSGQDPRVLFSNMEFVAGDVGAYRLVFSFYDEQTPLSLSDKILAVKIKRADGVVLSDSGEITNDTAVYIPKNDCFCVPGSVTFEIALMDSAKNYVTTKIIHASVLEGVGEPNAIAGTSSSVYVSLLAQTKTQLDAANQACVAAKALLTETQQSLTEKADALFITTETATSHTLTDTKDGAVFSLSVFGKTEQNGVPTPQAPIDLISVENPTLTIGDQTVTIPYTLRSIGNVKDEIVVDTKAKTVKHIKRLKEYVLDDTLMKNAYIDRFYETPALSIPKGNFGIESGWYEPTAKMRSYPQYNWAIHGDKHNNTFCVSLSQYNFGVCDSRFTSTSVAMDLLQGERLVVRPTSTYKVETDITDTECGQALLALATDYPETSVVCDADCKLSYIADTTKVYNNLKSELDTLKQAILSLGGTI